MTTTEQQTQQPNYRVENIDIKDIVPSEWDVRQFENNTDNQLQYRVQQEKEIQDLADSIKKDGVLNPITVAPKITNQGI
jgi:ParB-like chromosome segregation protein Spo0J